MDSSSIHSCPSTTMNSVLSSLLISSSLNDFGKYLLSLGRHKKEIRMEEWMIPSLCVSVCLPLYLCLAGFLFQSHPGWSQTHCNPPSSASCMLWLQRWAIVPDFLSLPWPRGTFGGGVECSCSLKGSPSLVSKEKESKGYCSSLSLYSVFSNFNN